MANTLQHTIEDRTFIGDTGNTIKYKRLVVRGFLAGEFHEIELPISKDQATLYNLLANSKEEEVSTPPKVTRTPKTILDDDDDEDDEADV